MLFNDGNVFYISDFDEGMENDIIVPMITEIKKQSKYKDGRIDLYVNSYGGYAAIAFHIIEQMEIAKRNGVTVRTIVTSAAYSCGSIVAVAGTPGERYMAADARHLAHYGKVYSQDSTPEQLERNTQYAKDHFKQILNHYKKYCPKANDIAEAMKDDHYFIPAKKAISWGMADKDISKLEI